MGMQTAAQVIADYRKLHDIDMADFHEWSADAGYDEAGMNMHDSAYLARLEQYVEERQDAAAFKQSETRSQAP